MLLSVSWLVFRRIELTVKLQILIVDRNNGRIQFECIELALVGLGTYYS
jgi:hypothetical protein